MAEQSAFEKIHIDENEKSSFEGLLEQLNLPPAVVTFYRENKTIVKVVSASVVAVVVAWALYNSYIENKIEKASSALSDAMELQGDERISALTKVADKYGSTSSGLWAEINKAHEFAREGKTDEGLKKYLEIKKDIGDEDALFPLIVLGIAQLYEKKDAYEEAKKEYEKLKILKGYESLGYLGAARVLELQKDEDGALAEYREYLNNYAASIDIAQKALVDAKIARIEASK